uniref:Uncharacterized protein n=1 Tax=Mycena chlorophos TaxID=658473 RepID=A0ABQ0LC09_MYCCL|nr:predicted protein [Mycena chlorophos]
MVLPQRPPLRRRSTTHVSATDTEYETTPPPKHAQLSPPDSPPPAPSRARAPLAPLVNGAHPMVQKSSGDHIHQLEKRVKVLENELKETAQGAPSPPADAAPPSATVEGDDWVRRSLDQSLRELQQHDPTIFLLPVPVREAGVTRRLGHVSQP